MGRLGLIHFPTYTICEKWFTNHRYYETLRLPKALLQSLRVSYRLWIPCMLPCSWFSVSDSLVRLEQNLIKSQEFALSSGLVLPKTAILQGDRWLSQVPRLSLWKYAPLAITDPGGDLQTHHNAYKTTAFRTNQSRRLSPDTTCRNYLKDHNYTYFGAQWRSLLSRFPQLRTSITGFAREVHY